MDPLETNSGKPSLDTLQFLQDNWSRSEVSAASRVCKVTLATGGNVGVEADIPVGAEIFDATVLCTRTHGGGTMQIKDGNGNAVSDAITCAVDTTVTRAGTIDDAYNKVTTDGIVVYANASGDGGIVYIHYLKT